MVSYRPPMSARTAYVLVALLLGGLLAAAFVSRHETRGDFIIRNQVGDFRFDAPEINPPDLDGPNVDGPELNGPNVNPPVFTFWDALFTLLMVVLAVALIVGLVLIVKRYGPGASDDGVSKRTSRIDRTDDGRTPAEGDQGWAAFERFCYELLQDPDPARAIRVVMRYAEGGMGRLEYRWADETPNEWLRRNRAQHADLGAPLATIVMNYNGVRFGGGASSPAERDDTVNALRALARAACIDAPPDAPAAAPEAAR